MPADMLTLVGENVLHTEAIRYTTEVAQKYTSCIHDYVCPQASST